MPEEIEKHIKDLKHADEKVRWEAAYSLGKMRHPDAVPALVEALKDKKDNVRRIAADALGDIGHSDAVPALLEALKDKDRDVRLSVAESLGKIGHVDAIPALVEAVKDDDWAVPRMAIGALGDIGHADAIPVLVEALNNGDMRWLALEALTKIGRPALRELIRAHENTNSEDERELIEKALEKIQEEDMPEIKEHIEMMGHKDSDKRITSLYALEKIGEPAVPQLIRALKHENSKIREGAAEVLEHVGTKDAVESLIETLRDGKWSVRVHAARALGALKDERAVDALIETIQNENEEAIVKGWALGALGKIGSKKAVPYIGEAVGNKDQHVGRPAVQALDKIGGEEAFEELIKERPDEHYKTSYEKIAVLEKYGERAIPHLAKLFGRANADAKLKIIRAIRKYKSEKSVPYLVRMLKSDADSDIKVCAANGLAELEDKKGIPALFELIGNENETTNESVLSVLARIGGDEIARKFMRAHEEATNEDTRKQIERGINKLEKGWQNA